MTLKYCGGDAHQAERVFGWGRHTVALGLAERHTGSLCLGAQAAHSGRHRWEDAHPQVAAALCLLAEAHAQQDPTLRTSMHNLTQLAGALRSFRQRPVPGRLTPCTGAASLARALQRCCTGIRSYSWHWPGVTRLCSAFPGLLRYLAVWNPAPRGSAARLVPAVRASEGGAGRHALV